LQGFDLVLELRYLALTLPHLALGLRDMLMLALQVVLNGWWCDLPFELAQGKRPQEGVVLRVKGRRLYHPGSRRCGVASVRLIGSNVPKL
jgi:hypothetical protein